MKTPKLVQTESIAVAAQAVSGCRPLKYKPHTSTYYFDVISETQLVVRGVQSVR